jgi:hypothetical protein
LRGETDVETTTWIDLRSLVPEPIPGVYEITATGGSKTDTRRLLLTDLHLVVKQAMGMIFVGSVIGFAGGIALTRILAGLLYGASATHATTYIAVAAIFVFAALLATYFPARQAAQVDPAVSLRDE